MFIHLAGLTAMSKESRIGSFCLACKCYNLTSIFAFFDIPPTPSRRIVPRSSDLALPRIHTKAVTPSLGIWSAVSGPQRLFLVKMGSNYMRTNDLVST